MTKACSTVGCLSWILFVVGPVIKANEFEQSILPILRDSCNTCHSTQKLEGELDLQRFHSVSIVKEHTEIWEQVLQQLELGEMPPKDAKQLSREQKKQLMNWVRKSLDEVALANAGDPGPVVLRRLSNHEYMYTMRDLTGIDTLDPAREFPVDGAAGEGFTNVGAALVMSPALLTKYLDAAKEVSRHMVLLSDGIRFSSSTFSQDWIDEALGRIRAIYTRHTTTGDASETVLQGIKLDTGTGSGRLPLQKYLDALQGRGSNRDLSRKYLQILHEALTSAKTSVLLDPLRAKYRDRNLTVADIEPWQKALWIFANVGHIGKKDGPKAWQEPITPLLSKHEMRIKLTSDRDTTLYLVTTDAGDSDEDDEVIWENPRLVASGRPDLPINTLPALVKHLELQRSKLIASTELCLDAIVNGRIDADPVLMAAWREYLGYGSTNLQPLLTKKMESTPDYNFIQGWKGDNALGVTANSSDATVRIPGLMKPHSIATHPSLTQACVVAWRCEKSGALRIHGDVADVHPECGNGVTWMLELRRGPTTEVLAKGVTKGATPLKLGPFENVRVEPGQVVALIVGPKDGNHVCDLTAINLVLNDGIKSWDLAKDVSPNILKGNPHGPWHFLSQPATLDAAHDLPAPIAAWRKNPSPELASKVRQHLENVFPLHSPLLRPFLRDRLEMAATDLNAKAPSVLEINIPAAIANGTEFVVTGKLASTTHGSVQMQVLTQKPDRTASLVAGKPVNDSKKSQWGDNTPITQPSVPIIVNDASEARVRFEAAFDEFRSIFPIALCYDRIVPVDEVVTLKLFHREDDMLRSLVLSDAETRELDRAWDELMFVSQAPLKQVDVYEQLFQYATQDGKPSVFDPLRHPFLKAAEQFKEQQKEALEPQKDAVLAFAERAWRRPLTQREINDLKAFEPRLMFVRVLTSPAFLYRSETPAASTGPVSDRELATRLSYFLWSSTPDEKLRGIASTGRLSDPDVLAEQANRMLKDDRIRRLATEFGCQYLHIRDVAELDEKSERHFPTFVGLRADMQEEVTRFYIDLFQNNRSVLSLIDADYTFINKPLADHYGIPFEGDGWQRVDALREWGRGGVLGFAATLAKQSGASRTSAILRGTWLSEVMLGEKIPNPPQGVPTLPEEAPAGLSERQLIESHSSDEKCAGCHKRIDPYGFALEGFDAIGRIRDADTQTVLYDGTAIAGANDLREYLLQHRSKDFLKQFSRKLFGYALGRSIQLSDQPLIEQMTQVKGQKVGTMIELIIRSQQFREIRGSP